MKAPSLRKAAALSAALHLTFFMLSFLILRQSNNMIMPSPYVVSLVSPGRNAQRTEDSASVKSAEPGTESVSVEKKSTKDRVDEKKEQKRIEDSISELKAKKRIEQIARLRSLVSIQGKTGGPTAKKSTQNPATGPATGGGEPTYIDKIAGQIHAQWIWPDYGDKKFEAVISVKIQKDGTLSDVKFEKKSGDRFFDRSVLLAIQKASPVTPPVYEMEIGIRFYP